MGLSICFRFNSSYVPFSYPLAMALIIVIGLEGIPQKYDLSTKKLSVSKVKGARACLWLADKAGALAACTHESKQKQIVNYRICLIVQSWQQSFHDFEKGHEYKRRRPCGEQFAYVENWCLLAVLTLLELLEER